MKNFKKFNDIKSINYFSYLILYKILINREKGRSNGENIYWEKYKSPIEINMRGKKFKEIGREIHN